MEGFEIINKYNERCLQWRAECCKLISEWALTDVSTLAPPLFIKQCSALVGFLCAQGSDTRQLLEAVHNARIEHVVLALRYLRDQLLPKADCNFCRRFTEKGEHVAGCLGETPQCERELWTGATGTVRCQLPTGHLGHHLWRSSTTKQDAERK